MKLKALMSCAVVALFCVSSAGAATPEQVLAEYSAALQAEGMSATARFIHPDEAARFKAMIFPMLREDKGLFPSSSNFREYLFGNGTTIEQAEAKSGEQIMEALLTKLSSRIPDLKMSGLQVLGSVREGEVLHFVTRGSAEGRGVKNTELAIVSLKPYKGSWKLMLSGEIEGMARALSPTS